MSDYDAIVVGTGAGGGISACVLAESGFSVLLVERGELLSYGDVGRDHLRNQRLSVYGHNAGPGPGNPRTTRNSQGELLTFMPWQGGYHANAACVGSGTRVYGAQAWRFVPEDFRMASIYGVPQGSSLADWPIEYLDLEPYYTQAEWEVGVCGDEYANAHGASRSKGYPMPPMRQTVQYSTLKSGADKLGWNTAPVPLLINSKEYGGRAACAECQHCVGFACPVDAKNGSANTVIPRALATGKCELRCATLAKRLVCDENGQVIGVELATETNGEITTQVVYGRKIIVSCGAIESARLLLNSRSARNPAGVGNHHDLVGRNLQGHYYPGAMGVMPYDVYDGIGPGVVISTSRFNHGNKGIIGGGMIANEFIMTPITFWHRALPPHIPRWGQANKDWMRENYRRTIHITGPVQEIPSRDARVTVNPYVCDKYGVPVAHLSGSTHEETVRTSAFMWERCVEWLKASGAVTVWGEAPSGAWLSGGQHQAGTCRMGNSPSQSVTDRWGRVHDQANLYILDSSLHVTNGGYNPVLTIMALAFRGAEKVVSELNGH